MTPFDAQDPFKFRQFNPTLNAPATYHFTITPDNDGEEFTSPPRALFIGGAGILVMEDWDGVVASYDVNSGQVLPFRPRRVLASGDIGGVTVNTTATNIVGLL